MSWLAALADIVETNQGILYVVCMAMMGAIGKMWYDIRTLDKDHADCRVENEKLRGEIAVIKKEHRTMRAELDALKVHQYSTVDDEGAFFTANGDGVVVLWTPATAKLTGYTDSEMIGQSALILIPERYHVLHHEQLSAIASGHKKLSKHFVDVSYLRTKAGMELPVTTEVRSYRVYRPDHHDYTWYFRVTLEERAPDRHDSDLVLQPKGPHPA